MLDPINVTHSFYIIYNVTDECEREKLASWFNGWIYLWI